MAWRLATMVLLAGSVGGCGTDVAAPKPAQAKNKVIRLQPGPNAQEETQTALIKAKPGDIVEFAAGKLKKDHKIAKTDERNGTLIEFMPDEILNSGTASFRFRILTNEEANPKAARSVWSGGWSFSLEVIQPPKISSTRLGERFEVSPSEALAYMSISGAS